MDRISPIPSHPIPPYPADERPHSQVPTCHIKSPPSHPPLYTPPLSESQTQITTCRFFGLIQTRQPFSLLSLRPISISLHMHIRSTPSISNNLHELTHSIGCTGRIPFSRLGTVGKITITITTRYTPSHICNPIQTKTTQDERNPPQDVWMWVWM